ncbi:MAG: NmrA family NAD(P)-binding protein [Proteobacteria bacterium]|nr:NmrA family NAD(P)-binding protein [Pseudomonadota bacterium]
MFVIAGVTGHVGSVVATELLAKQQKLKVLVRDPKQGVAWSRRGAEVAVGTLDDRAFLAGALRGASGLFTLLPPNFAAADFFAYQRQTSDAIAGAVRDAAVPHVVLLSSVGAELPAGTGPIKGLHYLENELRATGTLLTAIRAGFFQENLGSALTPAKEQGIFLNFTPSADYPMPMIATKDIGVLAARSLLNTPRTSEVIDLHGPAYSQRQLAERLGAALGRQLEVVDIPETAWVSTLTQGGLPRPVAETFAEMYSAFAKGIVRPCGDRSVAGETPIDAVIKSLV